MSNKFSFYDLVGYIIPGAVLTLVLNWFCKSYFNLCVPCNLTDINDSLIFIIASYLLGHLSCFLADQVAKIRVKKFGGWWSVKFLKDEDPFYSGSFKASLINAIKDQFDISFDINNEDRDAQEKQLDGDKKKLVSDDELSDKKKQEAFNLCYTLVVQKKANAHTELFNAVYGLYVNILTAFGIAALLSLLVFIKNIFLFWFGYHNYCDSCFLSFNSLDLRLGFILFIFFASMLFPIEARYKKFSEYFVDSVYRSFLVWYKNDKNKTQNPEIKK